MKNPEQLRKIVIKIGTKTLTKEEGSIDLDYFNTVAEQVAGLRAEGIHVIIVSSGAVSAGQNSLKIKEKIQDIILRQACAAIGQDILMHAWRRAFNKFNINVAQVLITYESFVNRKAYLNLSNSLNKLLQLGALPILNENDVLSTTHINASFGDNDRLSALVAAKLEADLLISLSDIDGLYNKDPRKHDNAEIIRSVGKVTPEIELMAGKPSVKGMGGMRTKIEAAKICSQAGVIMVIAHGREKEAIKRIVEGEALGTKFLPSDWMPKNKRWIQIAPEKGRLFIDDGAQKALSNGKSLLPIGIVKVEGNFSDGEVISLIHNNAAFAKAICDFSSSDLEKVKGKHSNELEKILGYKKNENVLKRENLVFL